MTATTAPSTPRARINRQLSVFAVVLIGLIVSLGILSAVITMAGAVIAQGQVTVQSNVKKIQHPTGGVVSEIRVSDGSHVKAGDVLLTLDATAPAANVAIVSDAVDALSAKEARLEAERDARPAIRFDGLDARPAAVRARADELRLFELHRTARAGERAQLRERIAQLQEQIRSYQQGAAAKKQQIALINTELTGVRQLFDQNLVPISRLNALERDLSQLNGDIAQLGSAAAEAKGKIAETELQILQVDRTASAEAGNQLAEVQNQLAELKQKGVTARQEFQRVEIRAPQDGVVDHLTVHTVGGVIGAGETLMLIVPDGDGLVVEARIKPVDIDKVHVGQTASLRFSAFDRRTTPEFPGRVTHVSAEAQADDKSGVPFYVVDLAIDRRARGINRLNLLPGMPVEAFIQTGSRSLLSYLTKPLVDQAARVFREE